MGTNLVECNGYSLTLADTRSVEHNSLAVVQAAHGSITIR